MFTSRVERQGKNIKKAKTEHFIFLSGELITPSSLCPVNGVSNDKEYFFCHFQSKLFDAMLRKPKKNCKKISLSSLSILNLNSIYSAPSNVQRSSYNDLWLIRNLVRGNIVYQLKSWNQLGHLVISCIKVLLYGSIFNRMLPDLFHVLFFIYTFT